MSLQAAAIPPLSPVLGGLAGFQRRMHTASQWLAVAVGFNIPLATSPAEVLVAVFFLLWLLSGQFQEKFRTVRESRVASWSLLFFGVMAACVCYTTATTMEGLQCLFKYREFLYIPLFLTVFDSDTWRQRGIIAFLAGCGTMMVLSYLELLCGFDIGLQSTVGQGDGASAGYVIWKDRIIHNLLLSCFVFILGQEFVRPGGRRWLAAALIAPALLNMFWLVQGRTGYVVLCVLAVLFLVQVFRKRGLIYAALLLPLCFATLYTASPVLRDRADATIAQLRSYLQPDMAPAPDPRLKFYESTLYLIGRHPWFGTGTGSFEREYSELAASHNAPLTVDPHCEYLLLWLQLGLAGLAVFLCLLGVQWQTARRLPRYERSIARGVLLAIAAGSLFNSLLLGFTGGLLYGYLSGLLYAAVPLKSSAAAASTAGPEDKNAGPPPQLLSRAA